MSRPDFIADGTRVARVLGKVLSGDLSVADVFFGRREASAAPADAPPEARCEREKGCVGPAGHRGGCTFDCEPVEPKKEATT